MQDVHHGADGDPKEQPEASTLDALPLLSMGEPVFVGVSGVGPEVRITYGNCEGPHFSSKTTFSHPRDMSKIVGT